MEIWPHCTSPRYTLSELSDDENLAEQTEAPKSPKREPKPPEAPPAAVPQVSPVLRKREEAPRPSDEEVMAQLREWESLIPCNV